MGSNRGGAVDPPAPVVVMGVSVTVSERSGDVCPYQSPGQVRRGLASGRLVLSELGLERLCYRCGETYPLDTEFWYWQPSARAGVGGYCKACFREVTGRCAGQPRKDRNRSAQEGVQ